LLKAALDLRQIHRHRLALWVMAIESWRTASPERLEPVAPMTAEKESLDLAPHTVLLYALIKQGFIP
jgi:hypothetical protein